MRTRKDLRPGDPCIIRYNAPRSGGHVTIREHVVLSAGKKWISVVGARKERFAIITGRQDTMYTPYMFLFAGDEEYQAEQKDKDRREELRNIIVRENLHFGIDRLTTDAAERIAAILQDPASRLPA